MKLLVIDSILAACAVVAGDLSRATGHETHYADSQQTAIGLIREGMGAIGVVVLFLDEGPEAALSFMRKVRVDCFLAAIREPKFVALVPGDLPSGYFNRFRAVGALWLVHGCPLQLAATVRALVSQLLSENGRPTFVVERSPSVTKFHLLGPTDRELIPYGPRLIPTMNCFVNHHPGHVSTRMLAEAANVTEACVRVHLHRLRSGYDEKRLNVGVSVPGEEVFLTIRRDGAFVHFLKARVLFA